MTTNGEARRFILSERRLESVIDAISEYAIYMIDPDGRVASWNAGAERIKGYTEAEVLGRSFASFFTEEDCRAGTPGRILEQAAAVGRHETEGWRLKKDGSPFWALDVVEAIRDEHGKLVGYAQITRDDTERQAAQDALRASETRFRVLVDGVLDAAIYMLDPNGVITDWNRGAERLSGYSADEIIGRHFGEFYMREDRLSGLPAKALAVALAQGQYESEGWRLRKDGGRFWADTIIEPVRDAAGALIGFTKVTRDITQRRAAEEALRESERQLSLLLGGITDYALFMLDPNGIVTSWNAGAKKIKGYDEGEIIGHHFSKFYTEIDRANGVPARVLYTATREGRYEAEGWRVRKDGSQFWANVVVDAIRDENGNLVGFAKVTRDISEKREAQLALQKMQEQLAQAQKMEALGRLTGGIAHDFNNILAIVSGHAEVLGRRLVDARDRRAAEAIGKAARRGEALTRQLLTFARRQRFETRVIDVKKHMDGVYEMLRSSLSSNFNVAISILPDIWSIEVDVSMLDLALLNLVMNSRDAMPQGGMITIAAENVRLTRGEIAAELEGEFVALAISDSGVGIPEDVLPKVFDPFFTTKNPDKGTGLGLSQVYGFVHQSGGGVTVTSKLHKGTTVTLYLPRSRAKQAADVTSTAALEAAASARILVVDDNPEVATVAASMLEELGYETRIVNGAERALDEIRNGGAYDLVFSDIVMPGDMNGMALALSLRRLYPNLPVVLATGYAESTLESQIPGEFPILRKPFKQAELGRVVAAGLARAQAARLGDNLIRFPAGKLSKE
jgi:PAS domain S-box-containing protein